VLRRNRDAIATAAGHPKKFNKTFALFRIYLFD
jgi:hypothetical protein